MFAAFSPRLMYEALSTASGVAAVVVPIRQAKSQAEKKEKQT